MDQPKKKNVQPGSAHQYNLWIQTAKQKLKEREKISLHIKITRIESIVNEKLKHNGYINAPFSVTEHLINITLTTLYKLIDNWQGVILSRVKKSLKEYRDYYIRSKTWYDQRKKKVFGALFWLPIFTNIEKSVHVDRTSPQFRVLLLNLMRALFNGTVKYKNTKSVRLINAGTIMCSVEMQKYLFSLDNSLQIKQWMEQCKNSTKIAETIINKIQIQLHHLLHINDQNINNENIIVQPPQTFTINIPQPTTSTNNLPIRNNINIINSTNHNNNINNINNINVYNSNHGMSYQSSNFRYSPLHSTNVPLISGLPSFNHYIIIGGIVFQINNPQCNY